MPNNYNGNSAAAAFGDPIPIILDGEVWQYGDAGSGVFGMLKPIIDRQAYLRQYSGLLVAATQTWLGSNIFDGPGKVVQMGADLANFDVECPTTLGAQMTIDASGSIVTDAAAPLHLSGPTFYTGASAVRGNRVLLANDADQSIDPSQYDIIRVPALTAARTYTMTSPPGGTPNARVTLYWYVFGTTGGGGAVPDATHKVSAVAQSRSANGATLTILSSTGSLHFLLDSADAITLSTADGTSPTWFAVDLHWNGTDWNAISIVLP